MPTRPLTPRRRPRQGRAVVTFDAIVEAAEVLLRRAGLDGFNTNAVAELAGVSIGSLYQYFPDKDALMAEIVRRDGARFLASLREVVTAPDLPAKAALHALIERAVAHQLDDPTLAAIIDGEQARLPLEEEDAALRREIVGLVATVLARLDPAPPDPTVAALDLLGIARGLLDTAAAEGERDAARARRRLERAAFGYLGIDARA